MAPEVYGAGHFRKAGSPGNHFDFLQQFRTNGGELFDENMQAGIAGPAGLKTLENMIAANAASIPGNNELDAVSLWAAFLTGKVAMTIPAGSNTGNTLRLRGKGLPGGAAGATGDQIVTLRVVLPETPDDELKTFMEKWGTDHAYDPRAGMENVT